MHAKVKEGHNEEETTRGASLRELQRFFKEHDKDEGYAGLRRIADEDGTAVWTILKETEVAAQLEKRAGERREEERRHEKIFSAQAHAPLGTTGAAWKEAEARLRAELKAEMIATALKEQEAPSDVDPGAAIGSRNTGYSGGDWPGRGGEYGGGGERVGGEGVGGDQFQVVVASNELQQIQLQMGQMQKDLAALNKGPAVTCKCSIM